MYVSAPQFCDKLVRKSRTSLVQGQPRWPFAVSFWTLHTAAGQWKGEAGAGVGVGLGSSSSLSWSWSWSWSWSSLSIITITTITIIVTIFLISISVNLGTTNIVLSVLLLRYHCPLIGHTSWGWGGMAWVYCAEMFPQKHRTKVCRFRMVFGAVISGRNWNENSEIHQ